MSYVLEEAAAESSGCRSVEVTATDVYWAIPVEYAMYDVVSVGGTYVP